MEAEWEAVRSMVLEQLDGTYDLDDAQLRGQIAEQASIYGAAHLLSLRGRGELERQVYNSLRRYDVIQDLLDDPEITEIMINGCRKIFYEKDGSIREWGRTFSSEERLESVIQQIAAYANKTVNEAEPIVDTRLADGSRVNIVIPPASPDGPCVTIRKFAAQPVTLQRLQDLDSISGEIHAFLNLLVRAGCNLFVSGGTGSGKTTLLNALSQAIPGDERIITIEDSAELHLLGIDNLVRMEARQANANGACEITIRDLIRTSLRMRPDRIIVGEVRGAEALELLQANNTGHDGGMSTGHANSCRDMLSRLETMVLMGMDLPLSAVRGQIASGIDVMIHLGRMRDKTRKVLQICEMDGVRDGEIILHPLYEFCETGNDLKRVIGEWKRVGMLKHTGKLKAQGMEDELAEVYKTGEQIREFPAAGGGSSVCGRDRASRGDDRMAVL